MKSVDKFVKELSVNAVKVFLICAAAVYFMRELVALAIIGGVVWFVKNRDGGEWTIVAPLQRKRQGTPDASGADVAPAVVLPPPMEFSDLNEVAGEIAFRHFDSNRLPVGQWSKNYTLHELEQQLQLLLKQKA